MRERPVVTPSLVFGLAIVFFGLLVFFDRHGQYWAHKALELFFPCAILLIGLVKLAIPRSGRMFGLVLTAVGVMLLLPHLGIEVHFHDFWPLALVAVGLILVWRALERRTGDSAAQPVCELNEWAAFGGGEVINDAKDFRGGEVFAMFGGYEVDLRDAEIQGEEALINATAMFGGIEIKVPDTWSVTLRGIPLLGGFSDETHHPRATELRPKRLIVKGLAMFGGVSVKN